MKLKELFEIIKKHRIKFVIGGIWGLVSGFLFPSCNIFTSGYMCFIPQLFAPLFLLPAYVSVIPFMNIHDPWAAWFIYYLFVVPLSIVVGALLGTGLGYFIEKHKTKSK